MRTFYFNGNPIALPEGESYAPVSSWVLLDSGKIVCEHHGNDWVVAQPAEWTIRFYCLVCNPNIADAMDIECKYCGTSVHTGNAGKAVFLCGPCWALAKL